MEQWLVTLQLHDVPVAQVRRRHSPLLLVV